MVSSSRRPPSRRAVPRGDARGGARSAPARTGGRGAGQVRIIGGEWRGRRLAVPDVPGLRPSGDRLRETLFNWLQPRLPGARCLDLFAGSGALGLEAASRGAASVTLVERDARAAAALDASIAAFDAAARVRLVRGAASAFLAARRPDDPPFDVVFVDPPFGDGLQEGTLAALVDAGLADGARVHVEAPARQGWPDVLPGALALHRERTFGEVTARLLRNG